LFVVLVFDPISLLNVHCLQAPTLIDSVHSSEKRERKKVGTAVLRTDRHIFRWSIWHRSSPIEEYPPNMGFVDKKKKLEI